MHKLGIMQGRLLPDDINYLQYYPSKKWKEELSFAEAIGFDYVELLYDINQSNQNPLVNINKCNELQAELTKNRLVNYSICADYFTKDPLFFAFDKLFELIDISNSIGNSMIIIPLLNGNNCSGNDFDRLLKLIKPIVEDIKNKDLKILFEISLDAKTAVKILNRNQTNVSICYDFGNATAFGHNISEEIIYLKDYLNHVHLKDRVRNGGPNVLLENGNVDFTSGFKALKEIGYTGNFTLETATGTEPIESAKNHYLFAKNHISTLL